MIFNFPLKIILYKQGAEFVDSSGRTVSHNYNPAFFKWIRGSGTTLCAGQEWREQFGFWSDNDIMSDIEEESIWFPSEEHYSDFLLKWEYEPLTDYRCLTPLPAGDK